MVLHGLVLVFKLGLWSQWLRKSFGNHGATNAILSQDITVIV